MTATADQIAPIIGHRAVITYTDWDLDGAEDYVVPTAQHAITGRIEWAEAAATRYATSPVVVWVEDPVGDTDNVSMRRLLVDDIVAATDLDQGGVFYDYGQPSPFAPGPDDPDDATKLAALTRRVQALAAELEERAQDDDRDSALIVDELPARLRKLLGGS